MADMTFKANLLPNSTTLGYSLGSETQQWNIYGTLNGSAAVATKAEQDGNGNSITATYVKKSGDTMTGALTTYGLKGTLNVDYGETLPLTGSEGQIFFQLSDPYYELPAGGTTGQVLIKSSNTDRDVEWSNISDIPVGNDAVSAKAVKDRTNNTLTYLNLGAAALAASAITWLCCWNGYEIRAISKAEMANAVDTQHKWVRLAGDTMSGALWVNRSGTGEADLGVQSTAGRLYLYSANSATGNRGFYGSNNAGTSQGIMYIEQSGDIHAQQKFYGAVWNDYAEYRQTKEKIEPGRCIREIGDDTLELTTERLMRGCEIVSDTFGFAIGQSEKNKTPTAASGRVLAYLYEDREEAKKKIGWPVCSGPNGTVSIMTEEEEEKYPSRIIGTISAVPDYEIWRAGDLNSETEEEIYVNGRIWIRIR